MLTFNYWGKTQRKPPKLQTNNTDGELRPQFRLNGKPVTIRNFNQGECRWPYGIPAADMLLCGRAAKGSFCEAHEKLAFKPLASRQRTSRLEDFGAYMDANSNTTKGTEYA